MYLHDQIIVILYVDRTTVLAVNPSMIDPISVFISRNVSFLVHDVTAIGTADVWAFAVRTQYDPRKRWSGLDRQTNALQSGWLRDRALKVSF